MAGSLPTHLHSQSANRPSFLPACLPLPACITYFFLLFTQRKDLYIEQRAGKAARLASCKDNESFNDPAKRVLLVMVALEGVPYLRIFPGMKPWTACVHSHRKYSIYHRELNHAQPARAIMGYIFTIPANMQEKIVQRGQDFRDA